MSNQLEKLISLSRKTGDRLIVFDPQKTENTYVIMPVEDYEKIVVGKNEVRGLTEDELLDKINRDIAIWKSDGKFDMETEVKSPESVKEWNGNDEYDYEKSMNSEGREKNPANKWGIPKTRELGAAEVIKDKMSDLKILEEDEDGEEDEDTQYLEEIKF